MTPDIMVASMSIFDRFHRRDANHAAPAIGPTIERVAGALAISVLAVEDPWESDAKSHSSSEAYKRGDERLVAFDVRIRNTATGAEPPSVSASKFHLFDDADYVTESIGRDARARAPLLVETFVAPGATVRGWVTFSLPWERRPARLQFFSGYLSAQVASFALPMCDAAEQARRRDAVMGARAQAEADRAREAQEGEARAAQEREARAAQRAAADAEAARARYAQQQRPPAPWRGDDNDDDEDPGAA